MEVKLRLSRLAAADLTHIRSYIAQFNPAAAERMAARLLTAAEMVAQKPLIGRPGPDGTREWSVVSPYIITYEVLPNEDAPRYVRILRIWHSAQNR